MTICDVVKNDKNEYLVVTSACLEQGLECAMENSDRCKKERLSCRRRKELHRLRRDGSL